jgi:prevent-host-death family protein
MNTVGIKALKNDLSRHIRAVAKGETVLVTDRGKVVAEIVPPRVAADGGTHAEREWAAMIREGLITPASNPMSGPPPRMPIMSFEELMADLAADREDR